MQTIKTSELSGAALDWAVAKCENLNAGRHFGCFYPSTDWAQGGPIIERERLSTFPASSILWSSANSIGNVTKLGKTPLIAAMRCYVASKSGDIVEVPDGLTEGVK